ncbi:hypothetical protein KAI92_00755 [Candidatus Parcubacteria bacterium]|nr:hypothetical protein [Candidatus Parcubacteria bacterium]
MEYRNHQNRKWLHLISTPIVYGMIIPLSFLDLTSGIYHNICFRLYGLKLLKRSEYIKIDRHKLEYLCWYEKINCAYCGYANGLINYIQAIFAETEKYWCGIKHKKDKNFIEPEYHQDFIDYDDEQKYRKTPER